ncbi:MAG: Glucokinase [Hyphomicrobiales bacterium]|nr:Glucokinase [Hyphomicrobiales bacterium]
MTPEVDLEFPYPVLVCDIGGTNVRIGAVAHPQAALKPVARLKTGAFPGLAECVGHALVGHPDLLPRSMLACGAGPVAHRRLHLTNARWTIDGPALAERLGLAQGLLLNDFEAQALALPAHRGEWLHRIGPSSPAEPGPQVILGPGTGLGVAALVLSDGRFLPLASEAAHMELGPSTPEDDEIWPHLDLFHGRITAEAVLSGPGLVRLHKARQIAAGMPYDGLDGVGIVTRGLAVADGPEARTIRHFWRIAGRFAGNMALTFLAHGGVTLAGGILPRILGLLDENAFRTAFEDKAPLQNVVRCIETRLLIAPDAVLAGMAAIAAHPDRYMIDYPARAWR